MKLFKTFAALSFMLALHPALVNAQAPPPVDPIDATPAPIAIPLDGGFTIVLGAAAVIGVKKLRDKRKKEQAEKEKHAA